MLGLEEKVDTDEGMDHNFKYKHKKSLQVLYNFTLI